MDREGGDLFWASGHTRHCGKVNFAHIRHQIEDEIWCPIQPVFNRILTFALKPIVSGLILDEGIHHVASEARLLKFVMHSFVARRWIDMFKHLVKYFFSEQYDLYFLYM